MSEPAYGVRIHIGRAGSGKSYTAKRVVERWTGNVAVWDYKREYAGPRKADGPRRWPNRVFHDFRAFLQEQATSSRRLSTHLVFQCRLRDFDDWCRWVTRTGNMLAVVDEAHFVTRPGSAWRRGRDGRPHPSPFFELISTARHHDVYVLVVTQRPASIDRSATAQVTELCAWRTSEPRDLSWLAECAGKEWADRLPRLGRHEFARWTPGDASSPGSVE